ncbi:hypothetical protein ABZ726_05500 [Streptomyces hundungensis]|uniref:hypothetical protein n=1 Tax=Streptomyces hundungensis TaxID=1077946 RepID=UPI0033C0F7F8
MTTPPSRRSILRRATFLTAGAAVGSSLLATSAHAAAHPQSAAPTQALDTPHPHTLTGIRSSNGWEMEKIANDHGTIYTRPVPGTPLEGVAVRMGDVETVLVHLIRRFHYEIEELRRGDVIGWRSPETVQRDSPESNQASGTAVQIRPDHHPAGARGAFFPWQLLVVRDILAEIDGVVRWGGDDRRPNESLFSIDVTPGDVRLTQVSDRLRLWQNIPGRGAGSPVDVTAAPRRDTARALELRQRKAV